MTQPILNDEVCRVFPKGVSVAQYNYNMLGTCYYIAGDYGKPRKQICNSNLNKAVCIWHIKPKEVRNAS
jgi:hypothetical protein